MSGGAGFGSVSVTAVRLGRERGCDLATGGDQAAKSFGAVANPGRQLARRSAGGAPARPGSAEQALTAPSAHPAGLTPRHPKLRIALTSGRLIGRRGEIVSASERE
jgi:hypothetical protein